MKTFDWENRLAILATGVVLFGVLAAAESAFADGEDARVAASRQTTETDSKAQAQQAMAEEAARSIRDDVELDLDIQLKDHTSTVRAVR